MEMTFIADNLRWVLAGATHTLPAAFRAFSQAAAPMVVAAVWQGAAVACGLAICLWFAPRTLATHRFAVWAAGFVAVLALPFLPMLLNFGAGAANGLASGLTAAPTRPWLQLDIRWSLGIGALWIAASVLRAVDLSLHSLRLRRLWRTAVPIASGDLLDVLPPESAAQWGLRRIQVCTTRDLDRPSVIGFWAPRILIPDWLLPRLTREELEQVVLHETEHLRRRDDWTNLFQKLCLILFPLNPALIWIERRLCREREMACDDGVVRITRAPRAYAACLASLAERGLQRRAEALSLGAWQRRPELAHRVHRILKRTPGLSPLATNALLAALGCGLVFGSVEFASCPQLIAFVPARRTAALQMTPAAPHEHSAQLLNASYARIKARRAVPGVRAAETVAMGPAGRHAASAEKRIALHRAAPKPMAAGERETAAFEPGSAAPRQVLLKAEIPVTELATPQAHSWIVLTTWEQVETSMQVAAQTVDANAGSRAGQGTSEAGSWPRGETTSRITVTRLIFRVYPANSAPTSVSGPVAAVPFRNGWLVIQL